MKQIDKNQCCQQKSVLLATEKSGNSLIFSRFISISQQFSASAIFIIRPSCLIVYHFFYPYSSVIFKSFVFGFGRILIRFLVIASLNCNKRNKFDVIFVCSNHKTSATESLSLLLNWTYILLKYIFHIGFIHIFVSFSAFLNPTVAKNVLLIYPVREGYNLEWNENTIVITVLRCFKSDHFF